MHNFVIETKRLVLRPLCIEDCDAVFQWVSDENVARYMVYNTYKSRNEVIEWLTSLQEPNNEYHFGFVRKEDNMLIGSGSIGPDTNRKDCWGFGYNFRKDCWGFGYATEATNPISLFIALTSRITSAVLVSRIANSYLDISNSFAISTKALTTNE